MIPSLPSNPNHKILPAANGIFLTKIRTTEGAPPVGGKRREGVTAHRGTKGEVTEGIGNVPSVRPGVGGVAEVDAQAMESAALQLKDCANVNGPIDCVCASASACLTHLTRRSSGGLVNVPSALFMSIFGALWYFYASPCRAARFLSYGPIKAVHASLKEEMGRASPEIQDYAINFIFQVRVMLPFIKYCWWSVPWSAHILFIDRQFVDKISLF